MAWSNATRPRASTPATARTATFLPQLRMLNLPTQSQLTKGEKDRATLLLHPIPEAAPVLFPFYFLVAADRAPTSATTHFPALGKPHFTPAGLSRRPAGVRFLGWEALRVPRPRRIGRAIERPIHASSTRRGRLRHRSIGQDASACHRYELGTIVLLLTLLPPPRTT
jgi:hypothetical protein